jgi:hypothetical protein
VAERSQLEFLELGVEIMRSLRGNRNVPNYICKIFRYSITGANAT